MLPEKLDKDMCEPPILQQRSCSLKPFMQKLTTRVMRAFHTEVILQFLLGTKVGWLFFISQKVPLMDK